MKYNKWIDNISRLFIPRPSVIENKRFDMAERISNFEDEFFIRFKMAALNQEDFITYPNYKDYEKLKDKIGNLLDVNSQNVYLSTGSGACIKSVCEMTMNPNAKLVSPVPSYPMYNIYGRLFGGKHIGVDYDNSLIYDLQKFISVVEEEKPNLVIISNPLSPIGEYKTKEEITEIAEVCKKLGCILLIDEAYIEFADGVSMIGLINDYDNVLISRTFSKAFGAAGIRLGYLIGNSELINKVTKFQLTYPLSNVTVKFGMYLLDNISIINDYVDLTINSRNNLCDMLSPKYDVINSNTNSIHFHEKTGDNSSTVDTLLSHDLAFKYGDMKTGTPVVIPGDDRKTWIRLSVGANIEKLDFVKEII